MSLSLSLSLHIHIYTYISNDTDNHSDYFYCNILRVIIAIITYIHISVNNARRCGRALWSPSSSSATSWPGVHICIIYNTYIYIYIYIDICITHIYIYIHTYIHMYIGVRTSSPSWWQSSTRTWSRPRWSCSRRMAGATTPSTSSTGRIPFNINWYNITI